MTVIQPEDYLTINIQQENFKYYRMHIFQPLHQFNILVQWYRSCVQSSTQFKLNELFLMHFNQLPLKANHNMTYIYCPGYCFPEVNVQNWNILHTLIYKMYFYSQTI